MFQYRSIRFPKLCKLVNGALVLLTASAGWENTALTGKMNNTVLIHPTMWSSGAGIIALIIADGHGPSRFKPCKTQSTLLLICATIPVLLKLGWAEKSMDYFCTWTRTWLLLNSKYAKFLFEMFTQETSTYGRRQRGHSSTGTAACLFPLISQRLIFRMKFYILQKVILCLIKVVGDTDSSNTIIVHTKRLSEQCWILVGNLWFS